MEGGDRDRGADEASRSYRRRQRERSRVILAALLALAAILYAITYVRMSEVEARRHEMLDEPHRLAVPRADSGAAR